MGYGPCPPARGSDASSFIVWTDIATKLLLLKHHILDQACKLTPIRKNNRGISGVERLRTPVAGIFIGGLHFQDG